MSSRLMITKGTKGPEFKDYPVGSIEKSVNKYSCFGKSIALDSNHSVNKRSLINFLNNHHGRRAASPILTKGWFFGYGGSSDAKVMRAFNMIFNPHGLKPKKTSYSEDVYAKIISWGMVNPITIERMKEIKETLWRVVKDHEYQRKNGNEDFDNKSFVLFDLNFSNEELLCACRHMVITDEIHGFNRDLDFGFIQLFHSAKAIDERARDHVYTKDALLLVYEDSERLKKILKIKEQDRARYG